MRIRTAIAAIIAGLLLVAACSSSGDSFDQATDGGDESSEDGGDGGDIPSGLFGEDCDLLLGADITGGIVAGAQGGGIEDLGDLYRRIAEGAPDEIRDDLLVLADFLEGFDFSDPSSLDPEALAALDTDAIDEAGQNVGEYFEENCAVE